MKNTCKNAVKSIPTARIIALSTDKKQQFAGKLSRMKAILDQHSTQEPIQIALNAGKKPLKKVISLPTGQ